MDWLTPHPQGTILTVKATPNAKMSEILGPEGPALKIKLHAKPKEGEANAELLRFLAATLNIPKSRLSLISGQTSRYKRVLVTGITPAALQAAISSTLPPTLLA